MRIERATVPEGEAIAAALTEKQILDGTYNLTRRPGTEDRFMLTPAEGEHGEFRVMVGTHSQHGRITLLQSAAEAVIMLGATTTAFV
jgi:hypothetical protein